VTSAVADVDAQKPLEVAIVGSGFMGHVHADAARLAGAHLRGVGVSHPERAEQAMAELGVDRAYLSPDEVAEDHAIDVVHVCTPNVHHAAYVEAALHAGKHVVCEKPLAVSLDEAARLTALADASGVVTAIPFVYRYYPTLREAAARAASGELGSIRLVHGSYLQDWLSDLTTWNWRASPELGGPSRAFGDIGVHWCDLVEFITADRISRVAARMSFASPEASEPRRAATEDAAVLVFEMAGGAIGTLTVSQVSHGQKNRIWLEVDGTAGAIVFDHERPDILIASRHDQTTIVHQGDPGLSDAALSYSRVPVGHPQGYTDCFALFVRDVYRAIRGAAPAGLPTFADGLRAAQIIDGALRAAASESWVAVEGAPA
jgi:predicted dehydrogenase